MRLAALVQPGWFRLCCPDALAGLPTHNSPGRVRHGEAWVLVAGEGAVPAAPDRL